MSINLYGKDALRQLYDASGHDAAGMPDMPTNYTGGLDIYQSATILEGTRTVGGHRTVVAIPVVSAHANAATNITMTISAVYKVLGRGQLSVDNPTDITPIYIYRQYGTVILTASTSAINVTAGAINDSLTYDYFDTQGTIFTETASFGVFEGDLWDSGGKIVVNTVTDAGDTAAMIGIKNTGHAWGVHFSMSDPGDSRVGNFLVSTGS
jgi:hypothetical protein